MGSDRARSFLPSLFVFPVRVLAGDKGADGVLGLTGENTKYRAGDLGRVSRRFLSERK